MPNSGADDAAKAQEAAAQKQIDFARETYGKQRELLAPYTQAGQPGLEGLLGLTTPEGQAGFYEQYYKSPQFAAQSAAAANQQLAAAEATGGIQSTSTSNQLARIAPTLGLQALQQQQGLYGNLTNIGLQGAGATAGYAGQQVPVVTGAYGDIGQAQANDNRPARFSGSNRQPSRWCSRFCKSWWAYWG